MRFNEWRQTYGLYAYRKQDGNPRTYQPLTGDYPEIFDIITHDADTYFHDYEIQNVSLFTDLFLSRVPSAWLRFKVQLEMMTGTLDGSILDPLVFEAGYTNTRELTRKVDTEVVDSDTTLIETDTTNTTTATATGENKTRDVSYGYGIQETTTPLPPVGEVDITKASSVNDGTAGTTNTTTGTDTATTSGETARDGTTDSTTDIVETERTHETRINYYDNLAFLRERSDRVREFREFYSYFQDLFTRVDVFAKNY